LLLLFNRQFALGRGACPAHKMKQNAAPFCPSRHTDHSRNRGALHVTDRQKESILSIAIDFRRKSTICKRFARNDLRRRFSETRKQNAKRPERQASLCAASRGSTDKMASRCW
jgi:hypothetical protein